MNRLLRKAVGLFLMLSATVVSDVVAQEPDSCTYVETNGILTVEMESADLSNTYWVRKKEIPGYTGSSYIEFNGGSSTGVPGRSQISYTFRITTPGRYSFRVRGYRSHSEDNDVWVQFPQGGVLTKYYGDSSGVKGNEWFKYMIGTRYEWYMMGKTQYYNTAWGETLHDVYVDFAAPGVYTVLFSGRASGFKLDRFALFKTSGYYGMSLENKQSEAENCFPTKNFGPYEANVFPDTAVDADVPFSFSLPMNTFGHPEGVALAYDAKQKGYVYLPEWLKFDGSTLTFSGTASFNQGGEYPIIIKAMDKQGRFALTSFKLTIKGNKVPVVERPLRDTTIVVNEPFHFVLPENTFSDPDGHTLHYLVTNQLKNPLPKWLDYNYGTRTFSGTPKEVGKDTIVVWANDHHGGITPTQFIIYIGTNHLPVVSNPIPEQQAIIDESFSFSVPANTFTDADGDALSYQATLANGDPLPAWLSFDTTARVFTGTPREADIAIHQVSVVANDHKGGYATSTFTLNVKTPSVQGLFGGNSVVRGNSLKLYPNPAENSIMVNLNGNKVSNLTVFDNLGNAIEEFKVSGSDTELEFDLSALKPGVYFVKASSDKINTTSMFVKR